MPTAKQLLAAYLRLDDGERRAFERAAGLQRRRCDQARLDQLERRNRAVHELVVARGGLPTGSHQKIARWWESLMAALPADLVIRGGLPEGVDLLSPAAIGARRLRAKTVRVQYLAWAASSIGASTDDAAREFPRISGPPARKARGRMVI